MFWHHVSITTQFYKIKTAYLGFEATLKPDLYWKSICGIKDIVRQGVVAGAIFVVTLVHRDANELL